MDDNSRPAYQFRGSSSNSNPANYATENDPMAVFNQNTNMGLHQNHNPNIGLNQNQNPNIGLHQNQNPNVGLPGPSSSSMPQPAPFSTEIPQPHGADIRITNDILNYDVYEDQDPYIMDAIDAGTSNMGGNGYNNGCASTSGVHGERFAQENLFNNNNQGSNNNSGFGNPIKISVWPGPPQPYICSCCQVLREIKTYNGNKVRNLEVHGRIGMFSHAVLEKFDYGNNMIPENHEYIMYDFCNELIDAVKNFLVQFCEQTKREGYVMVFDPLAKFYETLSVGLNGSNTGFDNSTVQPSPIGSGDEDSFFGNESPEESESEEIRKRKRKGKGKATATEKGKGKGKGKATATEKGKRKGKSYLAAQRERTAKMTIEDLRECFHLPILDVADKLEVCPTVIKKVCRKGGMLRWPYRRVKGLKNRIGKKLAELQRTPFEDKAVLIAEIQMLQYELASILGRADV